MVNLPWQKCHSCGNAQANSYGTTKNMATKQQPMAWLCQKCVGHYVIPEKKMTASEEEARHRACKFMGIPEAYWNATYPELYCSQEVKDQFIAWCKDKSPILVLTGPVGSGKTFMACVVLRYYQALNRSATVKYASVASIRQDWKQCEDGGSQLRYQLINADLLLLDDIGIVAPTDAFLEFLYDLVNTRLVSSKKTIYTTNMTGKELIVRLGEQIASRLTSRTNCIIKIESTDLRRT